MTIHRFFIPEILISHNSVSLTGEIAWQITKVLRLKVGDIIGLFDQTQEDYHVELLSLEKNLVTGKILAHHKNTNDPHMSITLYQALIPREKFEDVLEKATEIGVTTFVPLETKRTLIKTKDIKEEKLKRWQTIVKEATEQSQRGKVPQILPAMEFTDAIEKASKEGVALIAWENEETILLFQITNNLQSAKHISLFVGPEGGFTQEEINYAKSHGVISISLGKRILRSETAGIIFPSLVLYVCSE